MSVWAIADLHLSFARPERRERYAARWRDHASKIEREWRSIVQPDDLVLIPGDISMARNHRDLQADLAWIDRLPGTKVLAPGNHDVWWNGVENIRPMLRPSELAVCGDAVATHGLVICGSLGAPALADDPTTEQSEAQSRAVAELEQALAAAQSLRVRDEPLYVLWHFPPFDQHGRPGPGVEFIVKARTTVCLYGHLHAQGQWSRTVQGNVGGVRYYCVAADAVGFRPLRVEPRTR